LFERPDDTFYTFYQWFKNIKIAWHGNKIEYPIFPIISGVQGIGKDKELIQWLISIIPEQYIILKCNANYLTDERKFQKLDNCLVACFPEMEKFNKVDINELKSFITSPSIEYRILHSHNFRSFQNIMSYIGSTNANDFDAIYQDSSGERRFSFLHLDKKLTEKLLKKTIYQFKQNKFLNILLESVDTNKNTESFTNKLKEYQEIEMRYKTPEELFILELLDENPNINKWLTSDIYQKYTFYCSDNNFKYIKSKPAFGKAIKPILISAGWTYNSNKSTYSEKK
jgi:predicted P-loop ATPase